MLSVLSAPPFSEAIISEIRESWNVIIIVSVKLPVNHQLWHAFEVILIATKWNWLAMKCDPSEIKSHQEMQNWSFLTSGSLNHTCKSITFPNFSSHSCLFAVSGTSWVSEIHSIKHDKINSSSLNFFFSFSNLQLCLSYDNMHLDILAWNWQQKPPRLLKRTGLLVVSIGKGSALQSENCLPTALGDLLESSEIPQEKQGAFHILTRRQIFFTCAFLCLCTVLCDALTANSSFI